MKILVSSVYTLELEHQEAVELCNALGSFLKEARLSGTLQALDQSAQVTTLCDKLNRAIQ